MKYLFLMILLSSQCFAGKLEVYLLAGKDLNFDQAEDPTGESHLYQDKYNESFGFGLNYRFSRFRFSARYEKADSTYTFKNLATSNKTKFASTFNFASISTDYFFTEEESSLYSYLRYGRGKFSLSEDVSGDSRSQTSSFFGVGLGYHYQLSSFFFLFGEIGMRKNFIHSETFNGRKFGGYSIMREYIPNASVGIGLSY